MNQRNCPKCDVIITYKTVKLLNNANKKSSLCSSCCRKGSNNYRYDPTPLERKCPGCDKTLEYSTRGRLNMAIKNNTECNICCRSGKKSFWFGKPGRFGKPGLSGDAGPSKRPDVRLKISQVKKGVPNLKWLGGKHSDASREKMRLSLSKSKNWKGGISAINKRERELFCESLEYKDWRKSVLKRDNYTCNICDIRGGVLRIHHIKEYANYKHLRIVIDNGVTLCEKCHKDFHRKYGQTNLPDIFSQKIGIV